MFTKQCLLTQPCTPASSYGCAYAGKKALCPAHLNQACVDAACDVDQLVVQILLHNLLLLFKGQGLGLQHTAPTEHRACALTAGESVISTSSDMHAIAVWVLAGPAIQCVPPLQQK